MNVFTLIARKANPFIPIFFQMRQHTPLKFSMLGTRGSLKAWLTHLPGVNGTPGSDRHLRRMQWNTGT